MARFVEETIEVREAQSGSQPTDEGGQEDRSPGRTPDQFLWRGRLYRVTEVVDHWQERRAWWRGAAERPLSQVPLAREVWRVSARPGRTGVPGVYDLGMDRARDGGGETDTRDGAPAHWLLLRTQD